METLKIPTPTEEPGQCESAHKAPSLPSQFPQTVWIWKPHLQPKVGSFSRSSSLRPVSISLTHSCACPRLLHIFPQQPPYPDLVLPSFSTSPSTCTVIKHARAHRSQALRRCYSGVVIKTSGPGIRRTWFKSHPCFCSIKSKLISELQVPQP